MQEINTIVVNANEEEKFLRSHLHRFDVLRKSLQEKIDFFTSKGNHNEKTVAVIAIQDLQMLDIVNSNANRLLNKK